ncbi:MAG: hypothetical protein BAA04_07085 [Firmicutes bacterium ZCTH02-B6]|nr:MAG: hypothetical protein BAA04_07085 [Firmicutes bacterium ZCTH02-B6]
MSKRFTAEELAKLREIAEAATPGPWSMHSEPEFSGPWSVGADHLPDSTVATAWAIEWSAEAAQANAQHIAAFDPTTALELLDALGAARAEADRLRKQYEALRTGVERVVQDLHKRAHAAAMDWQQSGHHPYHDGASDAYYEAEQMVRRLLTEAGGGDRA